MKKLTPKRLWLAGSIFFVVAVLVGVYVGLALTVALPVIQPVTTYSASTYSAPSEGLPWAPFGQSAVGLNNLGVLASSGTQKPTPTASTAKLITAMCVLQKYPLIVGENGPDITLSQADVNIYNKYETEDGSDMLIAANEKLSEYQMLEAMLLPSADNVADSLAIWAFGSLNSYSAYANQFLKTNGLNNSHVGIDASGFDPSTTSTASDLVKIGELTMDNPVLANIVAKPSVSGFPLVTTIHNVNVLLGQNSIIGIKTGNTTQAGGVYISASKISVNNQPVTIVTAIAQAPTVFDAMYGSLPLIKAAEGNFSTPPTIASIKSGTVVGDYIVPWNKQKLPAIANQPIQINSWGGSSVHQAIALKSINVNTTANQVIGSISSSNSLLNYSNTSSVLLAQAPSKPSNWWKIIHPLSLIGL